jgi:outer membrane protein assembly factor BamC
MRNVNRFSLTPVRLATLALAVSLAGCSSIENLLSGDKIDYHSEGTKIKPLEVPPDLTQLQRESGSAAQAPGGVVSASTFGGNTSAAAQAPATAGGSVAPTQVGDMHIERDGNTRWLVSSQTPEQLWPQIEAFWKETGFNLAVDQPQVGVMETEWAENRAKLPQDFIRNSVGKVLNSLYDTGERDKFRTRVERTAKGTEIYISHRGMEEVVTGAMKDSTVWQPRATDPGLEAVMLQRLMVKLGAKTQDAQAQLAQSGAPAPAAPGATPAPAQPSSPAATGPAHARVLTGQPAASLQVDDDFDHAWRRVGLALDRTGFTVEDRDRANGIYYVRYVDPKLAKEEPGFFDRLLGRKAPESLNRYRIQLKRGGSDHTDVSVLNTDGAPASGEIPQRIVSLLVDDLK